MGWRLGGECGQSGPFQRGARIHYSVGMPEKSLEGGAQRAESKEPKSNEPKTNDQPPTINHQNRRTRSGLRRTLCRAVRGSTFDDCSRLDLFDVHPAGGIAPRVTGGAVGSFLAIAAGLLQSFER